MKTYSEFTQLDEGKQAKLRAGRKDARLQQARDAKPRSGEPVGVASGPTQAMKDKAARERNAARITRAVKPSDNKPGAGGRSGPTQTPSTSSKGPGKSFGSPSPASGSKGPQSRKQSGGFGSTQPPRNYGSGNKETGGPKRPPGPHMKRPSTFGSGFRKEMGYKRQPGSLRSKAMSGAGQKAAKMLKGAPGAILKTAKRVGAPKDGPQQSASGSISAGPTKTKYTA